jgi:hypothetical protein
MVAVEAVRPGGPKAHLPVSFASDQHISPKKNMGRKADDFRENSASYFWYACFDFCEVWTSYGAKRARTAAEPRSLAFSRSGLLCKGDEGAQ